MLGSFLTLIILDNGEFGHLGEREAITLIMSLMGRVTILDKGMLIIVEHFGWPDHHPPPFEYIDPILNSIHTHLSDNEKATAVLHCKGASTSSCFLW